MAVGRIRQAGGDQTLAAREQWAAARLDYSFTDPVLLETALTHRSASGQNNERLEFLGDAFLSLYVARRLYVLHPNADEGDLSRLRAALVRRDTLAEIARELDVDSHLILGAGEVRSGGAGREAAQADCLEALIGAVLLDGGHDAADRLLERLFSERMSSLPDPASLKDPKTRLQEWLQARSLKLPVYRVDSVQGRDHEQLFTVSCEVPDRRLRAEGQGRSRRRAEQAAAESMLMELTT